MAQGWNSDFDRDAMLRRVAIVLSSLPAQVVNQLLGSMGEESRVAVRRTMTRLSDVDPLERQRALQAFRVSMQQQPETAPSEPVSTATSRVMSSESVEVAETPVGSSPAADSDSPLAFLSDVEDDTLLALIAIEHPQAIALVLASISPAQAARVLPRMEATTRQETLSRLGRLGEIPEAAAAEVAEHFKDRLASHSGRPATGRRALDAILAVMPSPSSDAGTTTSAVTTTDGGTSGLAPLHRPDGSAPRMDFPSSDRPASDLSAKLRSAVTDGVDLDGPSSDSSTRNSMSSHETTSINAIHSDQVDRAFTAEATDSSIDPSGSSVLSSTDAIHQHLIAMTPMELCRSLGRVSTRDAMLTLCGLPNQVSEAALSVLPRGQSKKVRASMNGLGSLQLREIDEAKERVARASLQTADDAFQSMPMAA